MTEEPLQYLLDTFELKNKFFKHVFIKEFVLSIITELILTIKPILNRYSFVFLVAQLLIPPNHPAAQQLHRFLLAIPP